MYPVWLINRKESTNDHAVNENLSDLKVRLLLKCAKSKQIKDFVVRSKSFFLIDVFLPNVNIE